ncbi:Hsp20/alpha crystallin family protein [Evansella tamaricis]|uniref:Hsp20 family protein n=1 Tax=Evansella tamaricis TaxID=2069301 RepID=A0ABS6JL40_9BACI|nr:Hsp20 family protein [Evansella tamaricis]MBU9713018.1 Hsp20 family protein [Evansella tamaricis]
MLNRGTDLFGFPLFGNPGRKPSHTLTLNVQDTEKALIIEGVVQGFEKEHLQIEFVRNGLLVIAERPIEVAEGESKEDVEVTPQTTRIERFVPVFFPFTEKDVKASFADNTLKIVITKNKEHRKFISVE